MSIFQAGGALLADSVVYVKRKTEEEAIEELRRMNYLMFIEPHHQGKTSLINWLNENLRTANYSFTVINMSMLQESSEAAWYESLYKRILMQADFVSYTDSITLLTTSPTWRDFLKDFAICASKNRKYIVIALDEVGTMRQTWAESFFRTLRDVFDSRQFEPYFRHITFLLAGRYSPVSFIRKENESPFNVAVRLRLPDFTYEQFSIHLATHLRLTGGEGVAIIRRIYSWTAGQPYLTQLLCAYLAEEKVHRRINVKKAVQRLLREDRNHLLPIQTTLGEKPELQKYVIERVLKGKKVRFSPADRRHAQLELIGVIKSDARGYCIIRNPIYTLALSVYKDDESTERQVPKSIEIFISYAHKDEELCKELRKHLANLQRQGLITTWHDREISAGMDWVQEIGSHLNAAEIILLLVSPDFLASDYCYDIEMRQAIERHKRGETCVVPIILRPVGWAGAPFSNLQALPTNAKAITTWVNRDEAFVDTVEGIRKLIVQQRKSV